MDKNLITITINNYSGKKTTYTMPESAIINRCESTMITGENAGKVVEVGIEVKSYVDGIEVKEELI